jgi:hypothetical protein
MIMNGVAGWGRGLEFLSVHVALRSGKVEQFYKIPDPQKYI